MLDRYRSLSPTTDLPQLKAVMESHLRGDGEHQHGWYTIRNLSESEAEVMIYDYIGCGGLSADVFVKELSDIRASSITLRVNSPGGDVFDGFAIYNAIRRHKAEITACVDGIAASAASFLIMAADTVVMSPHAQMMIHEAHGLCMGYADDMREMADFLDKVSDNIASVYVERAGGELAEWRGRMKSETWLSDHEAVALGLADRLDGEEPEESKRIAAELQRPTNPLPTPHEGESQDDFVARCMGSEGIKEFDEKPVDAKPIDWARLTREIIEREEEAVFAAS